MISILILLCILENSRIEITEIEYENNKIPKVFNEYKIMQISDLHNKEFGKGQKRLLSKIRDINPDMIVITGDFIDSKNTNTDVVIDLVQGIDEKIPIFYVPGNHEAWSDSYEELKVKLEDTSVIVLEDQEAEIFKEKESIEIIGVLDPEFKRLNSSDIEKYTFDEGFKILLSHRPELFQMYAASGVDLVFSGHAHGGQFRLPFIGGVIAPNQGLFPKLTEGIHNLNDTSMVISRGLGNSIIPIRIFNRPELIVITLKS
ncbi:MAG: metallophosphoesterase [Clostridium sp.]